MTVARYQQCMGDVCSVETITVYTQSRFTIHMQSEGLASVCVLYKAAGTFLARRQPLTSVT